MFAEDQIKKLSKWITKFKRYAVTYKKGAYNLYNLFNSPQTMIQSFDSAPFCKNDKIKKMLISDTAFLKVRMYYLNPEEEMWVIVSNLHFKKNVLMENLYDKDLPIEFHFINIHIKENSLTNKSLVNGLLLTDRTWSVFKAGQAITEYHFKGSNEKNVTIFFTSSWLEKQKQTHAHFRNSKLSDFFDSSNTYMILEDENQQYDQIYEEMQCLADDNSKDKNNEQLRTLAFKLIEKLIEKSNHELLAEGHFKLNDKDRKNIQRAEQFIKDNLLSEFPGIEEIAKKIGISPTKLKKDFKCVHNVSIYQYFSSRQMQLAQQLLKSGEKTVREVATVFGYENMSKFSAVYKKNFNTLPSLLASRKSSTHQLKQL